MNDVTNGQRARRPDHQLTACVGCSGYSVRAANGRVYPLADRENMDTDALLRVVDG